MLKICEFRCFVFGGGAGSFPPNSPNHRGNQQLLVTVVTQTPKDLGGGLQAASAQIGTEMGKLSRGTAALGKGHP